MCYVCHLRKLHDGKRFFFSGTASLPQLVCNGLNGAETFKFASTIMSVMPCVESARVRPDSKTGVGGELRV